MHVWRIGRRAVLGGLVLLLAGSFFSFGIFGDGALENHGVARESPRNAQELYVGSEETDVDANIKSTSQGRRKPRVYIYPLSDKLNVDIQRCASRMCMDLMRGGLGEHLYEEGELKVSRTHQFSLEVLIHHQLLLSSYRTEDPEEADVFYIPAYFGTQFFCNYTDISEVVEGAFREINKLPYFKEGRPHISSLAKIEREMVHKTTPVLNNPLCKHVTFFVIEKEARESSRAGIGLKDQRVIVAPYPSYGHLDSKLSSTQSIQSPGVESRSVFMFLAASERRTNPFRNIVRDQISVRVKDASYGDVHRVNDRVPECVWFETPDCTHAHENLTLDWMKHSVFCLQPRGDSPTRKSFYDSILSGCIPVIFTSPKDNVVYPFQRVLDYTEFVVTINGSRVETGGEKVLDILKSIQKDEITRLHSNILKVARQLQYSYIDDDSYHDHNESPLVDALDMLMDEVRVVNDL